MAMKTFLRVRLWMRADRFASAVIAAAVSMTFVCAPRITAEDLPPARVLFFSKAASWEQKIVHRDQREELSFVEEAVAKLGRENGVEFSFSKDGTIFTPGHLSKFDALFFYTSGDLTSQPRNGRGDNFPLMTLEGKHAVLDAIDHGLGFVGCNTANYTFTERLSPGEKDEDGHTWRYTRMLGSGYMGHNEVQHGVFSYLDRRFPGMGNIPSDYRPIDQWYAFNRLSPDLHVILALDARQLRGNLYERESYPVAWARMQGAGRVFYTTMGHTSEIWRDPLFLQMLVGGIRWATHRVEADIAPDLTTVTPHANVIPDGASKFFAEHPPVNDPHFPNHKVWLERPWKMHGSPRVLVYTKSAEVEHPLVYRDTAWPSPLEKELLSFGDERGIDFIFSKDATQFTPENLPSFSAVLFLTSGDPRVQERNGLGDNYPLLPPEGLDALIRAVREGVGFIAFHTSLSAAIGPLIGARQATLGQPGQQRLRIEDPAFPGLSRMAPDFAPWEETFTFAGLQNDNHVVLATAGGKPVAWTRKEGQGRVFYSSLGHSVATWSDSGFREMLGGAIEWVIPPRQ